MKFNKLLSILVVLFGLNCEAQVATYKFLPYLTWTKPASEYLAKKFVIDNFLGSRNETVMFEVDALSSSASTELVTVAYNCLELNRSGIVLSFWGSFWNDNGYSMTGYGFKHLNLDSAIMLLDRLEMESNYMTNITNKDFNSSFTFSNTTFLLSQLSNQEKGSVSIRVFWKDFDAGWNIDAIRRTKRRIEKWFKTK